MSGLVLACNNGLARALAGRTLMRAGSTLLLVGLVALAEKRVTFFGATERVLQADVFGLILPIAFLFVSRRVLEPTRLAVAATSWARFGPSRRQIALGLIIASMIGCAALAAIAAAIATTVAHDPTAPALKADLLSTAWIGALGASAYAAYFAFGATFGPRGGGRYWALGIDLLFGSVAGFSAILTPRAHILNLLGGEPPLLLSQHASTASLAAMTAIFTLLALLRCSP